jgi:hypothetical protein
MRTALLLVATAMAVCAHHSLEAEYNRATETEYRATVIAVTWMNPHATFTASVAKPDGSTAVWMFEMGAPNGLVRSGFLKDALRPNDVVTVSAFPAKDGTARGTARRIDWADGHSKECADSWMWGPRKQ